MEWPWSHVCKLTFCDNALHTDETTDQVRLECARRDMLGTKAALKPNVELLKLLGKGRIDAHHILLQGTLHSHNAETTERGERCVQRTAHVDEVNGKWRLTEESSALTAGHMIRAIFVYGNWTHVGKSTQILIHETPIQMHSCLTTIKVLFILLCAHYINSPVINNKAMTPYKVIV